ncbi:MAG: LPS assembly lipoprotein LptE [Rhodobacteraceae bacterium]|nr:LPS assembly lipoprotein LptE [Paracoccaceae bacterium]
MLWSDWRAAIALPALFSAAACGFQPALLQDAPAGAIEDAFEVEVEGDRQGFLLEELLMQRLGHSGSAEFRLNADITLRTTDAAVPGAGGVDRKLISGRVSFEIRAIDRPEILYAGSATGSAEYSTSKSSLASIASQRDAEERMLAEVADRIYTQLILAAGEWTR